LRPDGLILIHATLPSRITISGTPSTARCQAIASSPVDAMASAPLHLHLEFRPLQAVPPHRVARNPRLARRVAEAARLRQRLEGICAASSA
jgi:hypothetical protein